MKLFPSIRNVLRANSLVRWLYFDCHMADIPVLLGIGSFQKQLTLALDQFLNKEELLQPSLIKSVSKDIKSCYIRYKITPQEYFLFELKEKNRIERGEYLSDHMIMKIVANKAGRKLHDEELNDKYAFYKINKEYFKRSVFLFTSSTSYEEFKEYAERSGKFIAKPNAAALGHGVEIFETKTERDIDHAFKILRKYPVEYILEDLIVQSKDMAVWNSSSVNTIRINSFLNQDNFSITFPFIRTGRRGSIVDNGGQGGIFASIDKESGKICTEGMDEKGHTYQVHPDSKLPYKGWQVPRWQELLQLTEVIHRGMPKHRYISWDFALTDLGWVLIEGNWGEFVCQQMTYKKGLKNEFISILNRK